MYIYSRIERNTGTLASSPGTYSSTVELVDSFRDLGISFGDCVCYYAAEQVVGLDRGTPVYSRTVETPQRRKRKRGPWDFSLADRNRSFYHHPSSFL